MEVIIGEVYRAMVVTDRPGFTGMVVERLEDAPTGDPQWLMADLNTGDRHTVCQSDMREPDPLPPKLRELAAYQQGYIDGSIDRKAGRDATLQGFFSYWDYMRKSDTACKSSQDALKERLAKLEAKRAKLEAERAKLRAEREKSDA